MIMKQTPNKNFIKSTVLLSLVCLLFLFFPLTAQAYSAAIEDVSIYIRLDDRGDANVVETWQVTVDSGTEWYLLQDNLGEIVIDDFAVTDETGQAYFNEDDWDINRSLEEKAGKCGIVKKSNGGYELCWGVGSYGEHTFHVSYTMSNFVKGFTDYDGFNQRVINNKLNANPQHIQVVIDKVDGAFTSENTGIWAFGFDGKINLVDGKIVAESNQSLQHDSSVGIMARFDKGLFTPNALKNQSFAVMQDAAFAGSDYSADVAESRFSWLHEVADKLFFLFINFLPFVLVLLFIIVKLVGKKVHASGIKINKKDISWCREIPFNGFLDATYYSLKKINQLENESCIIGSYLLQWVQQGIITITETEKKSFLGLGDEMQSSIVFGEDYSLTQKMSQPEQDLYGILLAACGGDSILQEKEFYKWSKNHYEQIDQWLELVQDNGENQLLGAGLVERVPKKHFFGLFSTETIDFNIDGQQKLLEMLGFKKYLLDFTIINERKPAEVQLWQEYLVFACLFGIADTVAEAFKALYPSFFEQPNVNNPSSSMDLLWTLHLINNLSVAGYNGADTGRNAAATSRSGGGGGFSSMGGGGGFSGGGSGGGSR